MSATLDLAGATTTLAEDASESYYTITDSVGGGSLVMSAGSSISFDDTAGAGFVLGAGFSITINGTASSHCTIKSATATPTNGWTAPSTSITITAMRCDLYSYSGDLGDGYTSRWTFTNCNFFPFALDTEPRTLIANALTAEWTTSPTPVITDSDAPRYPDGVTPLIKVYPIGFQNALKGRAESERVDHHLTVSIRSQSQANSYTAMKEACRILDLYLDHPWSGYDLMTRQAAAYRAGSMYISQWDIELHLFQLHKAVVR